MSSVVSPRKSPLCMAHLASPEWTGHPEARVFPTRKQDEGLTRPGPKTSWSSRAADSLSVKTPAFPEGERHSGREDIVYSLIQPYNKPIVWSPSCGGPHQDDGIHIQSLSMIVVDHLTKTFSVSRQQRREMGPGFKGTSIDASVTSVLPASLDASSRCSGRTAQARLRR